MLNLDSFITGVSSFLFITTLLLQHSARLGNISGQQSDISTANQIKAFLRSENQGQGINIVSGWVWKRLQSTFLPVGAAKSHSVTLLLIEHA